MGIDVRRIRYSWVSAAEGAKWADLVNDTVREIRELGPYTRYREVADYIERRKTMDKLTEKAAALLREGAATLVIGYGRTRATRPVRCSAAYPKRRRASFTTAAASITWPST